VEATEEGVGAGGELLRALRSRVRRRLPAVGAARAGATAAVVVGAAGVTTAVETPVACCAPLGAPLLGDEEAHATAELFKALGDPARVRIVNLLATSVEPVCACDLYEPLGLSQPTVSHHLKKLTEAGLVEREQRGKWAYFSLRRDAVEKLAVVADLKGACC
jgi:ArsR family transcriptional regulator, arsenate/arsenite/antimonite-responsive transcriptional repressor